jgi:hypothetical protein
VRESAERRSEGTRAKANYQGLTPNAHELEAGSRQLGPLPGDGDHPWARDLLGNIPLAAITRHVGWQEAGEPVVSAGTAPGHGVAQVPFAFGSCVRSVLVFATLETRNETNGSTSGKGPASASGYTGPGNYRRPQNRLRSKESWR